MICSKCGKELLTNETVCSLCGQYNNLNSVENVISEQNKVENFNEIETINQVEVSNFNKSVINNDVQPEVVVQEETFENNIAEPTTEESKVEPVNLGMLGEVSTIEESSIQIESTNNNEVSKKSSKRGIIIVLLTLAIGILIALGILGMNMKPNEEKPVEENKKLVENTYTMYVKINPLVKLNVKQKYYECKNESNGKYEKCGEVSEEVLSYDYLNNDAKEIYKDIDLKTKNIVDALVVIYDKAKEVGIEFTDVSITTNWNNTYTTLDIINAVKEKSKYSNDFQLVIDVESGNISTQDILEKYEIEEDIEIKYMVTFNSDNGSQVVSQEVKENEKITKPADPTREGYKFIEWQINGNKYDFESLVNSDIELKAKWELIKVEEEKPATKYTVTFNTDGGNSISGQLIEANGKVVKPSDPIKKGYIFNGWLLNGKAYNFDTKVTSNITLTANWKEESSVVKYTVSFNTDGGSSVSSQTIELNEKVKKPTNPTKKGYTFIEWQINGKAYNFDTKVTSNITLTATWRVESTIDLINLNDNIMVEALTFTEPLASTGYIFSTNAKEVFGDDIMYGKWIGQDLYEGKFNQLQFDTVKEEQVKATLESLSKNIPAGVPNFEYQVYNHTFRVTYSYFNLSSESADKFPTLYNQLIKSRGNYYDRLDALFDSALIVGYPGAGFGGVEYEILTERLCEAYNLKCSRW